MPDIRILFLAYMPLDAYMRVYAMPVFRLPTIDVAFIASRLASPLHASLCRAPFATATLTAVRADAAEAATRLPRPIHDASISAYIILFVYAPLPVGRRQPRCPARSPPRFSSFDAYYDWRHLIYGYILAAFNTTGLTVANIRFQA